MKTIALICDVQIINRIFTLVSKKLSIDIDIITPEQLNSNYDILIVEENFTSSNIIKYKSFSKYLVAIVKDETNAIDFDEILQKPFLPSQVERFLSKILQEPVSNCDIMEDDTNTQENESLEDLIDFVDTLGDDLDETDCSECTISQDELGHGGVLDADELSKLHEIVNDEQPPSNNHELNENDWIELSDVIDQAIDDINDYNIDEDKPVRLLLNQYSINELSPLFNKLNQNIIDNLTDGKEITLKLKLEV